MSDQPSFDEKLVRQLADILNETHLTEIEYESKGCRVRVARGYAAGVMAGGVGVTMPSMGQAGAMAAALPASSPSPVARTETGGTPVTDYGSHPGAVKSPMVGVAYTAANPGAAPFVTVGASVSKGQTLLIIEAMKVMNQIRAPKNGTVSAILFRDGDPVEFDQPLIVLD